MDEPQPHSSDLAPDEIASIERDAGAMTQAVRDARLALREGNDPVALILRAKSRRL
jgi:hypothetical protein